MTYACAGRATRGKFLASLSLHAVMVTDIELAQATRLRPILDVAGDLGLGAADLVLRGDHIAKVRLAPVERAKKSKRGRLVLVTGTTPTRQGEGKTLTTVGVGQALNRLGTR